MSNKFGLPNNKDLQVKIQAMTSSSHNPDVPLDKIDAIANKAGFISRDPQPRQTFGLHITVPVEVADHFKRFCKINRYSYGEALEELLKHSP